MHLNIGEVVLLLVVFLAVVLVAGSGARDMWPVSRRRQHFENQPLVDEVGPYEVPDESAPSKQDD
jgi:hypothetical protein